MMGVTQLEKGGFRSELVASASRATFSVTGLLSQVLLLKGALLAFKAWNFCGTISCSAGCVMSLSTTQETTHILTT